MKGVRSGKATLVLALLLLGTMIAAGCGAENGGARRTAGGGAVAAAGKARRDEPIPPDNATRAAYAGTEACAACHADLVAAFRRSPMHRMTRALGAAHPETEVQSPWPSSFRFHGDRARFEKDGAGERRLVLDGESGSHVYGLTKIIGGRVREDFVGIELGADGRPLPGAEERVLPLSWRIEAREWRYKGYSVMTPERHTLHEGAVWRTTCLGCHNTMTLLDGELGGIAGRKARSPAPWPDRLLPPDERRTLVTTDADALAAWTKDAETRDARFGEADLVELGIGCEACHQGSRAHAADPGNVAARPSFTPRQTPYRWDDPLLAGAGRTNVTARPESVAIDRVCDRCHQVLFSAYEWTWEGGTRTRSPGGSTINSGEARDLLLGGCRGQITCTMCHDPHRGTSKARLAELATPAGNPVCTTCHQRLASDDALKAHAHHDPKGQGGSCIACHMAQKNMGLDGRLTRYHRIGTPADPGRVLLDRPMECALCHADRTTRALVETTERWYHRRYDRPALEALYGDLDQPMLLSTLERGKPHEKAVAMDRLGEARDLRAVPLLEAELTDPSREPYPLVRQYARDALHRLQLDRELPSIDAAGDHGAAPSRNEHETGED
jgi:predicted CXXCH cytochrome family protein